MDRKFNHCESGKKLFCSYYRWCLSFSCLIRAQNISPGMKLWGVVTEVNEKDLVVSLPGGLRGLVRSVDAVDPVLNDQIEVL